MRWQKRGVRFWAPIKKPPVAVSAKIPRLRASIPTTYLEVIVMSAIILHHQKALEQALFSAPNLLPAAPLARQGNPLSPNDPTPYYLDCFLAWFHNHPTGAIGLLDRTARQRVG